MGEYTDEMHERLRKCLMLMNTQDPVFKPLEGALAEIERLRNAAAKRGPSEPERVG